MSSARRRAAIVLLATLVGMAVTARLGVWQLDRAAQKRALQSARDERAHLPPLDDASLATTAAQAEQQHYRPVRLRGTWRAQNTVYLDNRQMDGRPGFFVVTPLLLPGGDAVLVQRGWAPRDMADRTRVPAVPTPAGEVELVGLIAPPPARLPLPSGRISNPRRLRRRSVSGCGPCRCSSRTPRAQPATALRAAGRPPRSTSTSTTVTRSSGSRCAH
jgi:cytochrome oxidase assembly protein ShyY1